MDLGSKPTSPITQMCNLGRLPTSEGHLCSEAAVLHLTITPGDCYRKADLGTIAIVPCYLNMALAISICITLERV